MTEIGNEAFFGAPCKKITLPGGIRQIGLSAFRHSSLEEIEIPSGVEVIKRAAFSETDLHTVSIPASVAIIGSNPFSECENLAEIRVSGDNPAYKTVDGVLYTKDGKTLIQYPGARGGQYPVENGTETIGYGSFAGSPIEGVVLPDSLRSIENMAFFECQKLASFNLPDSLENVGNLAFGEYAMFSFGDEETPLIESVHIGPNLKHIGTDAFIMMNIAAFDVDENNPGYASSGGFITSKAKDMILEVPGGLGKIVTIPDGITTLQDNLLVNCEDGADFIIPDSVFRFGTSVFPYTLGDKDESGRYKYIFEAKLHCSEGSAAEAYAKQFEIEYDDITDPENLVYETVTEETPAADGGEAAVMTWRIFKDHAELVAASGGNRDELAVPSVFRDLPVTAIRHDDSLYSSSFCTRIEIPDSVDSIDSGFFSDFFRLSEVTVDENNSAFKSVDGVLFDKKGETLILYPTERESAEYVVPDKTETIEENAFYLNSNLTKITLPKSLRSIGKNAFAGSYSLTAVEFGRGLKEIGDRAFNGCPLQDVHLPSSVTSIGSAAFTPGDGFGRIELPDKLESLGYMAFYGDTKEPFTQDVIRIPANLVIRNKFLGNILFESYEVDEKSENYTAVDGLLMSRDGRTLVSVPTLTEGGLAVPEGTLYIEYSALADCEKVTDIYLPDSVLDIGGIGAKNYETGEYLYVIHCAPGSEAQRKLDAKGVPWVEN